MIMKEEPKNDTMHFFNKELFPLLNKHAIKDLDQDYFDFKTLIEHTDIIKSREYDTASKNACQIFMNGISLCFDNIFISNNMNRNSSELYEFNKKRENFVKDVNILFRFEKVVNEYYQNYAKDKFRLYELEDKFNIFNGKDNIDLELDPIDNSIYTDNFDENSDIFPFKTPFSSYKSDFIFENKKIFINSNSSINEINNNIKINNINQNNINNNNKNGTIPFSSINSAEKNNPNQEYVYIQSQSNYIKYKHKYVHRKKKIKEYKFKNLKRENVDKKILRKFKKYLKKKMREKTENEVKTFISKNDFWPDYISMNLMPPFSYDKENISFKSFNSKYLVWFFEHKFSQELFNIFINKNYDDILNLIKEAYNLTEETEDYNLLKIYINSMPMIYGDDSTNSTTVSSHITESDEKDIKINKEEKKEIKEKKENNDMIIESDSENKDNNSINFDYISSNINSININNNEGNNNNFINNDNFSYINDNNDEMNIESNINMTENCDINNMNMNINNSFEKDKPNLIQFDQNIFNDI